MAYHKNKEGKLPKKRLDPFFRRTPEEDEFPGRSNLTSLKFTSSHQFGMVKQANLLYSKDWVQLLHASQSAQKQAWLPLLH